MKWLSLSSSFFRNLFRRKQAEQALEDEVASYTELLVAEKMKRGMTEQEARRAARLEMGGASQIKEEIRDVRVGAWLLTFLQDVRHGLRLMRNQPAFTLAVVLTFAIGIGANTAIFSLVNGLLLRPVPVPQSDRIAYLVQKNDHGWLNGFSYPDYDEIRQQAGEAFSDLAAVNILQRDGLSMDGKTQTIWTEYVTTNFFSMLKVRPVLGSFIAPSEKIEGSDPVMVVSYTYWKNHLDGDPGIVGRKVALNGRPVTIIGVAPEGFAGLTPIIDTQGYLPIGVFSSMQAQQGKDLLKDRQHGDGVLIFARLRENVSLAQAQPVLSVIAHRLAQEDPTTKKGLILRAAHLGSGGLSPDGSNPLLAVSVLFFVLSGLLLLLASANVANLLLVRAVARNREMAVRSALGAARWRLVRQVLVETMLLGLLGCAGGAVLGGVASRMIGRLPLQTDIPMVLDFHFDWRVFSFALSAAVFVAMVAGLVPAFRAARVNLNDALRESSRGYSAHRQRFRAFLVVAQVGGSLMLLIVAGLFVRSMHNAERIDLGFDPTSVVNFGLNPHTAGYDDVRGREFYGQLLERVRSLPGVESASVAATIPMGPEQLGGEIKVDGYQQPQGQPDPSAQMNVVSPGYFSTMHIPILEGRDFQDSDTEGSQRVALISEMMAQTYWPGKDPIGRTFSRHDDPGHTWQVVGVARNIRNGLVMAPIQPFFYVPMAQDYRSSQTMQVRTSAGSPEAIAQVIGLIHSMDATVPVFDVRTMMQALDSPDGFLLFRLAAVMASSMGLMGLILAVVGVYGVISYSAAQRTHEIGIRIALGARPTQVLATILRQGVVIVLYGSVFGILAAAAIAKLVGSFLVDVSAVDPTTYIVVSLLLTSIALLASFIPARRATRVDPMLALRCE